MRVVGSYRLIGTIMRRHESHSSTEFSARRSLIPLTCCRESKAQAPTSFGALRVPRPGAFFSGLAGLKRSPKGRLRKAIGLGASKDLPTNITSAPACFPQGRSACRTTSLQAYSFPTASSCSHSQCHHTAMESVVHPAEKQSHHSLGNRRLNLSCGALWSKQ